MQVCGSLVDGSKGDLPPGGRRGRINDWNDGRRRGQIIGPVASVDSMDRGQANRTKFELKEGPQLERDGGDRPVVLSFPSRLRGR